MELNVKKQPVYLNEIIFDGQTEQGVEFDYVLPDYYPDIFKILKCTLIPCISSYSISGSQLFCDGVVYIKALYLSSPDGGTLPGINCIEHRYTFSKTIDLVKPAEKALVTIIPKTDYCNCRAVSGRRIDVRGAVSCKVKIVQNTGMEIIDSAEGMGLQSKKEDVVYCSERLSAEQQFSVREDIETGDGYDRNPAGSGISAILTTDFCASVTDCRIIPGKVIVKGEAKIKSLYIIKNEDGTDSAEVMEASVPLSRIIDIEGITEDYSCFAFFRVMDCDLEIKPNETGENRMFGCDLTVNCIVSASLEHTVSVLTDVYSTDYDCSYVPITVKAECSPSLVSEQLNIKTSLESGDGNVGEIFDARCDISNVICKADENGVLTVTGQLCAQAIGRLKDGTPVFLEKNEPFDCVTNTSVSGEFSLFSDVQVFDTSFSISSDNHIEIRILLTFNACLCRLCSVNAVKEISVDTEKPKNKTSEYALKLYYAEKGENIWSIAKRYNTCADAIISENDIESEVLSAPAMLLIPLV